MKVYLRSFEVQGLRHLSIAWPGRTCCGAGPLSTANTQASAVVGTVTLSDVRGGREMGLSFVSVYFRNREGTNCRSGVRRGSEGTGVAVVANGDDAGCLAYTMPAALRMAHLRKTWPQTQSTDSTVVAHIGSSDQRRKRNSVAELYPPAAMRG